jgi:hypothetical protein
MNLPCIDGFIVPRTLCPGVPVATPKSGLYVEDLPGFSTVSLAAVEPGKYLTAQAFIDEKMRAAGQMILDQLRVHLGQYVQEAQPRESGTVGSFDTNTLAGAATKRGVQIRVDGGALTTPMVPRVWLKCEDDIADLVLKVSDGYTTIEHTISVVGGGVENEVWLNFEGRNKTVQVWVEDIRFKPFTGTAKGTKFFSSCTTCGHYYHSAYRFIAGGGWDGTTELTTLLGIRAEVVVMCSLEPIACILMKRFRWAVLYQFGALVLQEWLASSRVNYFSIHSKDWAAASLEKWESVDIPKHMKPHLKTLAAYVSQMDEHCIECGVGVVYAHSHP